VHPGMTHEIRLTAPATAGRYKVKCTHRFHKLLGMGGTIIVR
jgi:plastocyanin